MTRGDISRAFDALLLQAGLVPPEDIAWRGGGPYAPVEGRPYLVPRLSSYQRQAAGIGANPATQHDGTYTVRVMAPAAGGPDWGDGIAAQLVRLLGRATSVSVGTVPVIILQVTEADAGDSGDFLATAVTVTWTALEALPA